MFGFKGASKMSLRIISKLFWLACFPIRHCIHRNMDEMIREAMSERKLLAFDYDDKHRIVEPHVYGRKDDRNGILAKQTGGESSQKVLGWRRMYLRGITNMKVMDETFPGKIETTGEHSKWDIYYYIVD